MKISDLSLSAAILLLMLVTPLRIFASAGITISLSAPGSYSIDGAGLDGVAAVDLTVMYDRAALANPRVTQGSLLSGALVAVNPNVPGVIRFAAVTTTPITGNGRFASIVFDSSGQAGGITSVSARLSALNGTAIPAQASVVNPGAPLAASQDRNPTLPTTAESTPATPTTPTTPTGMVFGGSIVTPGETHPVADSVTREDVREQAPVEEEKGRPVLASREPRAEKAAASSETAKTRKIYTQQSVLERFREFKGERTPKAFISLFKQDGLIGYRQEPSISVSDGKKTLKAIFIAPFDMDGAPDTAVAGAELVSLLRDPDYTNTWIAELRPHKNGSEAALTVSIKGITMVLPATVAPLAGADLDKSGKVTEEDFRLFLKRSDAGKKRMFDLNGDGRQDFRDAYIFTANYLLSVKSGK